MSRNLPLWGAVLAVHVCTSPSFAQGDVEELLFGKGLRRTGSMYVLRAEDEVKKAAEVVEARLKQYRLAVAREKDSARDAAGKTTLVAALTRQRSAMKQQSDQAIPTIQAQIQGLKQQQSAMSQQLDTLRDAARYADNRFAAVQYNQMVEVHNGLSDRIGMLQRQANQLTAAHDELTDRIDQLGRGSVEPKGSPKVPASPDEAREAYARALGDLRKLVDETKQRYEAVADDAEVKDALEALGRRTTKIKYGLGPSKRFLDQVKALEQAEASLTTDASEAVRPEPTPSRRPKTAKRK